MNYIETIERVEKVLEDTKFCVLATSNKDNIISASQVCLINDGLKIYVQTDESFEKAKNIKENPNVAINVGAFYLKGIAKILGHPSLNKRFIELIKEKHLDTYNSYTNIPTEVLI